MLGRIFKVFIEISVLKTIYFNFRYLKLKQAIKFPIFICRSVKLKSCLGSVLIPENAKTGLIRIGVLDLVAFNANYKSFFSNSGKIIFRGYTRISIGCCILLQNESATLEFGENFSISNESCIFVRNHIRFGNNCMISWKCLFMDTDMHAIYDLENRRINDDGEIIVCDNVWIASEVKVLKNSIIPKGCVIGANSLVSGKLPKENCIYCGERKGLNLLRENIRWKR